MKKTMIQLETLTCPSCIKRIEGTLEKTKGVNRVEVKFNSSKVEIDYDEESISVDNLSHILVKLGYKVLSAK
ncbi:heavy-metal-associated domain-containing protein [Peloplasma aerotolerans]|uniref:Heavy metal-associated domain-containing protein n=1 Tax=Peloplasma aerotolerans TaxID=3044389 RepID=A0AAW6U8Q8_9MOLU|nr:heavy metal-associated domain-containing protein [Mariniplasma sp. M4Ah]MDI6453044.1 heavy metal-associated domain-containing protein [Mariniplasma sp. M4Ah]MDR4968725.1 heavy metal-associated domain-containing protein [Acholeplasmataceae bacterium]